MGFLSIILKLINPLGSIGKSLAEAYAKKQDATTQQAKIAADVEIEALSAKQAVLIAESATPINSIVRALLTIPAGAFLWKVIIYDKLLAAGSTDGLSDNLWIYVFMVLGFYFVENVSRIWKR